MPDIEIQVIESQPVNIAVTEPQISLSVEQPAINVSVNDTQPVNVGITEPVINIDLAKTGPTGSQGPAGPAGAAGEGVPAGGDTGQVLSKASDADNDTEWIDPPSSNNGFKLQDPGYEKTSNYVYVGYAHSDGRWYIYRRTISDNIRQYASGSSDYAANWSNRAGLSYS